MDSMWGYRLEKGIREAYLVHDTVPCVAGIVHNDMQLTAAKSSGLLDQAAEVSVIEHVTDHGDRASTARIDIVGYLARLLAIDIRDDNLKHKRQLVTDGAARGEGYEARTLAPSLANNRAHSAPIPCPDPVMMATCPVSMPRG